MDLYALTRQHLIARIFILSLQSLCIFQCMKVPPYFSSRRFSLAQWTKRMKLGSILPIGGVKISLVCFHYLSNNVINNGLFLFADCTLIQTGFSWHKKFKSWSFRLLRSDQFYLITRLEFSIYKTWVNFSQELKAKGVPCVVWCSATLWN